MLKRLLPLFLGLSLAGCGSSESDFVVSGPVPVTGRNVVVRAYLGMPAVPQGATLRLETLDGQKIAEAPAAFDGAYVFHNVAVGPDFRAVARLNGSNSELAAEVRGFDGTRMAVINVPTTLASRYLRRHPEVGLAGAEDRVRAALALPGMVLLDIGIYEVPTGFFSHIDFSQAASRQGGWEPFLEHVLTRAEAGQAVGPFLLTNGDLNAPVTRLGDPALEAQANAARRALRAQLNLPESVTSQRVESLAVDGPTSLLGQFVLGVGTGVAGNVATAGINAVFGWAANQMGLNYGTANQLAEIQATLNSVAQDLSTLNAQIQDASLLSTIRALDSALAPTETATNNLQTALANSTVITNQPGFSQPPNFSSLIQSLGNNVSFQTILNTVQPLLLGQSGAILQGQTVITSQYQGQDAPASMQGFPFRGDDALLQALRIYNYYALKQTQTLNVMAEQAHNFQVNADPVAATAGLLATQQQAVLALKAQRQQQPFLSNSGVIADLENGVMWLNWLWSNRSYDDAVTCCEQQQIQVFPPDGSSVIYSDWRLPTLGECSALRDRGQYCPKPSASVPVVGTGVGASTAGLPEMGFYNIADNFTGENNTGNSNGSNGNVWMSYYELDQDGLVYSVTQKTSQEYRMNQSGDSIYNSSGPNCFFSCRQIGPNPVVQPYSNSSQGLFSQPPPFPLPSGVPYPSPILAPVPGGAEALLYGVPTSIGPISVTSASPVLFPNPSPNGSPVPYVIPEALQMDASVTCTLTVGGAYTMGYGTTTASFSNPTYSYSGSVSSGTIPTPFPSVSPGAAPLPSPVNLLRDAISWNAVVSGGNTTASTAQVLNLPSLSGWLVPYAATAIDLVATLGGATARQAFTPSVLSPHTLDSLQISPRNQTYSGTAAAGGTTYPYYCTAFFRDRTLGSYAGNVTWTVSPASNSASATIIPGNPALLSLNQPTQPVPTPFNLTITATAAGNVVDSTTIQIIPGAGPAPSPSPVAGMPTIASLAPSSGPVAGGTAVTVRGANLGTVTAVTVGGVAASTFVVNTASELTVVTPPGVAGSAAIVVTTPAGTATANFLYTQ